MFSELFVCQQVYTKTTKSIFLRLGWWGLCDAVLAEFCALQTSLTCL